MFNEGDSLGSTFFCFSSLNSLDTEFIHFLGSKLNLKLCFLRVWIKSPTRWLVPIVSWLFGGVLGRQCFSWHGHLSSPCAKVLLVCSGEAPALWPCSFPFSHLSLDQQQPHGNPRERLWAPKIYWGIATRQFCLLEPCSVSMGRLGLFCKNK